jgi:curved DNA-binding protein
MTHYATLGVADAATPDEIKSAYRKLAKQHHPDLGGDVAKFQQISEAYETLADADKRAHYDHQLRNPQPQFHHNGFPGGFHSNFNGDPEVFNHINEQFSQMFGFPFAQARQAPRNRNIRIQLSIDFLETLDTCQKTVEFNLTTGFERITIDLPAGINDNTVLQMAGRGDNAIQSVPRGTLEIVVKVIPHSKFSKIDDHVFTDITIDCFQAVLGHNVDIDTPRGRKVNLRIPAGTQSGTQFGITDEGFSRSGRPTGKFIIKVNVMIPTALTREQLALVEQIQNIKPINT